MRRRRTSVALAVLSLVTAGMAMSATPAAANHVACGAVVTSSIRLDADLGPCPGDGLVVRASNVTVNLNGKRIFAAQGPGDTAGIRLANPTNPPSGLTGVTVRNGTIQGFDAGVAIFGGSRNVVREMVIRDNVNPGGPNVACDLGDGIALTNSDNNRIENNRLVNNGPYGGISLIFDSDANLVRNNSLQGHNIRGIVGCGNANQDEGIRIEGPGANDNRIETNSVADSALAGIGVHGHRGCQAAPGSEPPNTGNMILTNMVTRTANNPEPDGIHVLEQGPFGTVVCAAFNLTISGNKSIGNARHGIRIPGTSTGNTINGNQTDNNGGDGIRLEGPIFENRFTNVGPTVLDLVTPDQPPFATPTDFRVMTGSGSGNVTARLVPIDIAINDNGTNNTNPVDTSTSGCELSDYTAAGFRPGDVALVQRGTCTFVQKVSIAVQAGASAVVMFNEGQPGRTTSNFGSVGPQTIPVLSASYELGRRLYNLALAGPVTIRVVTNTTNVTVQVNVGAESNTLLRNRGRNNGGRDGRDLNPNCDNNNWNGNQFGTVNQPCVATGGTGTATP
ncbi:MAG TPA: PA domain-containing protein [Acidimicrobiales bacterium]|nr:PA domain-containing protein [Acidimicrobiales bacterium]